MTILYEDRDVLVVDKPPGLLTMGTETQKERTAYFLLMKYVRKGQDRSRKRIFIVHRLDRETSGVLIFAKSEAAKVRLQENWPETRKQYFAVVHGVCKPPAGTITTYLVENQAHAVYSTDNPRQGKLAKTAYRVLEQTPQLALLEIDLLTGRKHQIRVHMAGIGHAVVGDRKYGRESKPHPRLALHAKSISFQHPFDGRPMTIETALPPAFRALMRARPSEPRADERPARTPRRR